MAAQDKSVRFLLDERARKLDAIEVFASGKFRMDERSHADWIDSKDRIVKSLRRHVTQMENILTSAGAPFDP